MNDRSSLLRDPKKQLFLAVLISFVALVFLLWLQGRGEAKSMLLDGERAFVAWGSAGVGVMDVHDPTLPRSIAFFDTSGSTKSLQINGKYAYVADGTDGLRIFDVSNPNEPREEGFYRAEPLLQGVIQYKERGSAESVVIDKGIAYIAYGKLGLEIVSLGRENEPVFLKRIETKSSVYRVTLDGTRAYLAAGREGLVIVDVEAPNAPKVLARWDTPGVVYDVKVVHTPNRDTYALLADGSYGVQILKVNDPQKIEKVPGIVTNGTARSIALDPQRRLVYLALGERGIQIVDLSNLEKPNLLGKFDTPGYANEISLRDQTAYVLDETGGIQILDVNDPKNPKPRMIFEYPGRAGAVQIGVTILVLLAGLLFWSLFFPQFLLPVHSITDRLEMVRHFWLYWMGAHGPATFVEDGVRVDRAHNGEWDQRLKRIFRIFRALTWPFSYLFRRALDGLLGLYSGVIYLDCNSAGVLRNVTGFTRPVGPGVVFTERFEILANAVELRLQNQFAGPLGGESPFAPRLEGEPEKDYQARQMRRNETAGFTRDGIEIVPNVIAIFKLRGKRSSGGTEYGCNRTSVWRAVVHEGVNPGAPVDSPRRHVAWNELPVFIAVDLWREYLRLFTLNQLFTPCIKNPRKPRHPGETLLTGLEVVCSQMRERMTKQKVLMLNAHGEFLDTYAHSQEHDLFQERGIEVLAAPVIQLRMPAVVDEGIAARWKERWDLHLSPHFASAGQAQRAVEIGAQRQAWTDFAQASAHLLALRLETEPKIPPGIDETIELLIRSTQEKTLTEMELQRRLGLDGAKLNDAIAWIRSH